MSLQRHNRFNYVHIPWVGGGSIHVVICSHSIHSDNCNRVFRHESPGHCCSHIYTINSPVIALAGKENGSNLVYSKGVKLRCVGLQHPRDTNN